MLKKVVGMDARQGRIGYCGEYIERVPDDVDPRILERVRADMIWVPLATPAPSGPRCVR